MQTDTKLSMFKRLVLTSPFFLLVFLLIPIYSVLGLKLRLPVSGDLLLFNNGCFLVCVAFRFVRYALGIRSNIRYGADYRPPANDVALGRTAEQLKAELAGAGYAFEAGEGYGEKRDLGYLGTTILYGGMTILLLFGSYDYMREYSVMVRTGVGEPMALDKTGLVGEFEAGALAKTAKLPLVQVRKQILPNEQWPKGATEIALVTKDRKELATSTIAPGKPFRYGGLEFHMTKFIFDGLITIRQGKMIVYDNFVIFYPLAQKKGVYSYYGSLIGKDTGKVKGDAWLKPENKAVRVDATIEGKKIFDGELELWGKNKLEQGQYLATLEGLAHWSEIRVARGRHRVMLMIGAGLLVLGGILRLMIRPERVWLEEAEGGCRARAVGRETKRMMKD